MPPSAPAGPTAKSKGARAVAKNPVSSNDDSEKAASYSVDSISDLIVNRIETGVYRQGDQLIARTIAQELGTSIAPVREALNRLKGEGLVEFFSNRSARVKELSDKELLDSLEVWQANAMLQVRLAAQRAGIRDNAERMRKSWRKIRSAGMRDDRLKFLQRVKEFSNLLKEICDNAYLDRVEKVVHTELWSRNVVDAIEDKDWIPYVEGFCAVGEAVIAGDQKAAEKAYANHLQRFTGHVLRKMARDK